MSTDRRLTSTSYAVLGLLGVRSWSSYELTGQMTRALRWFWPRAESNLYLEPKTLVAHGLARASGEAVGRRRRTVYRITPKGRRELRRWLDEPGAGPVLEWEQLLKLFFVEQGTKAAALANLRAARKWGDDIEALSIALAREYLAGGPFPDRMPQLILTGQFLTEFGDLVSRWAKWAEDAVTGWPEDMTGMNPDLPSLRAIAERTPRQQGLASQPVTRPT
ncbi:MAG: PadR family transcriptional regulator [Mycobacteriales bacterium]